MPVTWTQPTAGQPHGPGYQFEVATSIAGPWPTGSQLELVIVHPETGQQVYFGVYALTSSSVLAVQGRFESPDAVPRLFSHVPLGAAVTMTARFVSSVEGLVDQGDVSVQWQPALATPHLIWQELLLQRSLGGFASADRADLQVVKQSVTATFDPTSAIGNPLTAALGSLVGAPPTRLLRREDPILISGRGTLTRPALGVPVAAYGFTWDWHTIPPGWGFLIGGPDEYINRVVQFGVVNTRIDGSEYFQIVADVHSEAQEVTWGIPWPQRVLYEVASGGVVSFRWLTLTPLQPP